MRLIGLIVAVFQLSTSETFSLQKKFKAKWALNSWFYLK